MDYDILPSTSYQTPRTSAPCSSHAAHVARPTIAERYRRDISLRGTVRSTGWYSALELFEYLTVLPLLGEQLRRTRACRPNIFSSPIIRRTVMMRVM